MSTGNKSIGTAADVDTNVINDGGALHYYSSRVWTGSDGKFLSPGVIRMNPYSATIRVAMCRHSNGTSFNGYPAPCLANGHTLTPWTTNDTFRLQSKLVNAVKDHNFNLAVAVAEGHKTLEMIHSNMSKIGNAILAVKHGNFARAARCLGTQHRPSSLRSKDVSGRWLELQYGWKPLLQDVYNGMGAWHILTAPPRQSSIIVTTSTHEMPKDTSNSPTNYTGFGTRRAVGRLQYVMTEDLSVQRSLGLYDPLSVAWEVLPYSFVADWFIPIGTYLENLNTIPHLKGTFVQTIFTRNTSVLVGVKPQGLQFYKGGAWNSRYIKVDRTVSTGLSTAFPQFKPLDRVLSPLHFANALALLYQRFV